MQWFRDDLVSCEQEGIRLRGYWRYGLLLAGVAGLCIAGLALPAHAQTTQPKSDTEKSKIGKATKVLGVVVKPHAGTYLVLKDANVRAKPETRSKRVGRLKAGKKVEAVGRVKGPWLAVQSKDKVLGFVYGPILMPLIDGALAAPIKGRLIVAAVADCRYTLEFLGKSKGEEQRFSFADYEVEWRCKRGGNPLLFNTPVFLTEGPYQGTQKPVHQITIDLLELEGGLEEVFSVHTLWDRAKRQLRFDQVSIKKFARAKPPPAASAGNLSDALKRALAMALTTWAPSVWAALAKKPETR